MIGSKMGERWLSFYESAPFENKDMLCVMKSDNSPNTTIISGFAIRKQSKLFFISREITSEQKIVPCLYCHKSITSSEIYSLCRSHDFPSNIIFCSEFELPTNKDLYLDVHIYTPGMTDCYGMASEDSPAKCLKEIRDASIEDLLERCPMLSSAK